MWPGTCMTSCLEAGQGILRFEKKQLVEIKSTNELVKIRVLRKGSTNCAARGGVRWKSQHRKKLCLSLLMSTNLRLKKVIKSFVLELKESRQSVSYILGFLMSISRVRILVVYFWTYDITLALVALFEWHINLRGLFATKDTLLE